MNEDKTMIQRDLENRKEENRKRMKADKKLERLVLNFGIDWAEFHCLLFDAFGEVSCDHDYTQCR